MVQKKPPHSISSALGLLDRAFQTAGVWLTISDHLVVLDDQADVLFAGIPKPLFQSQTVATGIDNKSCWLQLAVGKCRSRPFGPSHSLTRIGIIMLLGWTERNQESPLDVTERTFRSWRRNNSHGRTNLFAYLQMKPEELKER